MFYDSIVYDSNPVPRCRARGKRAHKEIRACPAAPRTPDTINNKKRASTPPPPPSPPLNPPYPLHPPNKVWYSYCKGGGRVLLGAMRPGPPLSPPNACFHAFCLFIVHWCPSWRQGMRKKDCVRKKSARGNVAPGLIRVALYRQHSFCGGSLISFIAVCYILIIGTSFP